MVSSFYQSVYQAQFIKPGKAEAVHAILLIPHAHNLNIGLFQNPKNITHSQGLRAQIEYWSFRKTKNVSAGDASRPADGWLTPGPDWETLDVKSNRLCREKPLRVDPRSD